MLALVVIELWQPIEGSAPSAGPSGVRHRANRLDREPKDVVEPVRPRLLGINGVRGAMPRLGAAVPLREHVADALPAEADPAPDWTPSDHPLVRHASQPASPQGVRSGR